MYITIYSTFFFLYFLYLAIRKRATAVIGALGPFLSDAHLDVCINVLLDGVDAGTGVNINKQTSKIPLASADTRVLVQTLGTVSRAVGNRVGKHLVRIVPALLLCIGNTSVGESGNTSSANDLRKNCFHAIETFLLSSPQDMAPFLSSILTSALEWLRYDPNYIYMEDENEGMDEEEDDFDDAYDEGDIGDDVCISLLLVFFRCCYFYLVLVLKGRNRLYFNMLYMFVFLLCLFL